MRILATVLCVALLAGCASSEPEHRYYVLDEFAAASPKPATAARRDDTLLIAPVSADGFYRTREMAYSRAAGTRGYYQYSAWTELPAQAIGNALLVRLERSGAFRAVAAIPSGVNGTLLLRVHLDEIYHDATTSPGIARVALTAQLSDAAGRTLIERRSFAANAPATSFDADGAVVGLRQALDAMLDDVVNWAAAVPR